MRKPRMSGAPEPRLAQPKGEPGAPLLFPNEPVTGIGVTVIAGDGVTRVQGKRECACAGICAGSGYVEGGDAPVCLAQEAMVHAL